MVHPNQEPAVIAGQGTIAMEVLNQARVVNSCVTTGKVMLGCRIYFTYIKKKNLLLIDLFILYILFTKGTLGRCTGGSCRRRRNGCWNSNYS